jgi:hypothetical protein
MAANSSRLDHLGELTQERVPGNVAEAVVDALEMVDVEDQERQGPRVARTAVDLPLERLVEVTAVVELGEAIDRHQPIDLFVVARLDVVAEHELEDGPPDLQPVTVDERVLAHVQIVDVRAVGRAEVGHAVASVTRARDAGVMSADAVLVDGEVALRRAPDLEDPARQRDAATELLAIDLDEAPIAAAGLRPLRRGLGPNRRDADGVLRINDRHPLIVSRQILTSLTWIRPRSQTPSPRLPAAWM